MKHRASFLLVILAALTLVFCARAPLQAQLATDFKADMKMSGAKLPMVIDARVYWSGSRMRMEMSMLGMDQVILSDPQRSELAMLIPASKTYFSLSTDGALPFPIPKPEPAGATDPCANTTRGSCKKLAGETISGFETEKWEFSDGANTITTWISPSLKVPVKTVIGDMMTIEFSNVVEGKQPEELFQIPGDFQKIDMGDLTNDSVLGHKPVY